MNLNKTNKQKTLLELISNYSNSAGNKMNIQKLIAFLHEGKELLEFEIKNTIPFTLALKKLNTYVQVFKNV